MIKLKQTTTVEDYYGEFKDFLNCLQPNEENALSIFIHNFKSDISKSLRLFYPKTFTHALKLAKQLEFLFDELPRKHSSTNPNTTTSQTIIPPPPKQSLSIPILTNVENQSITIIVNPSFSLNPLKKVFILNVLVPKESREPKYDKLPCEMVVRTIRYLIVDFFTLKNVQSFVGVDRLDYVRFAHDKNLDRLSILRIVSMFVDKLVVANDPYRFRLLVIRSCNVDMRKTMLIMDIDNVIGVGECTREDSDWFTKKIESRVISLCDK